MWSSWVTTAVLTVMSSLQSNVNKQHGGKQIFEWYTYGRSHSCYCNFIILTPCGPINFQHSSTCCSGLGCHMTCVQWSLILPACQCCCVSPLSLASKVNRAAKLQWIIDGCGSGSCLWQGRVCMSCWSTVIWQSICWIQALSTHSGVYKVIEKFFSLLFCLFLSLLYPVSGQCV